MHDGVLLDRNIHNYDAAWSDTKLRIILNRYKRYVVKYEVRAIIIKVPPPRKQTPAIRQIIRKLEALAGKHGCTFDLITKSEMKHVLRLRSTSAFIECARMLYPELSALYEKGARNGHGYYKKLYEAVLSAHIFEERQRAKALQAAHTTE